MPSGANITDIHQSKAEFYISQDSVDRQNAAAEAAGDLPEDLKKHYPTDLIASEKLKDVTGRKGNRLESHHQTILNLDMLGKNATVISRIIGVSSATVHAIQKTGLYLAARRFRLASINKTVDEELEGLSTQALANLKEEVYHGRDPARKLKATLWVLEERGHSPVKKNHMTVDVGEMTQAAFQNAVNNRQKRLAVEAAEDSGKQKDYDEEITAVHMGESQGENIIELTPDYEGRQKVEEFFDGDGFDELEKAEDAELSLKVMAEELEAKASNL